MESCGSGLEEHMRTYKQTHLTGPIQEFEASLANEQEALTKCRTTFEENRFSSIAFYFNMMPEPDMSYLHFKQHTSTDLADQKIRQTNLQKLEDMIAHIESERNAYLMDNLEDAKMSTENYYDLKIKNLEGRIDELTKQALESATKP